MISLKFIIGLLIFILFIHIPATIYHWYWTASWLDMPMHFLGGALTAVIFVWLFKRFPGYINLSKNFFVTVVLMLGFVALIGVLWELSEFLCDLLGSSKSWVALTQQGVSDTMADLFFDILGGFVVAMLTRFGYNRPVAQ